MTLLDIDIIYHIVFFDKNNNFKLTTYHKSDKYNISDSIYKFDNTAIYINE